MSERREVRVKPHTHQPSKAEVEKVFQFQPPRKAD